MISGMSWESSAIYYRIVNEAVKERLGGHHSAETVMYSVDFAPIKRLQHEGRWGEEAAAASLAEAARKVEKGGRTSSCCAPTPCTGWQARSRRR
jgi:aspartate racemase